MSDAVLNMASPNYKGKITGRGFVAYYDGGLIEYPRRLLGIRVRIDDRIYKVQGVEMHAVSDDHPANHWGPFGLLLGKTDNLPI